MADQPQNPYDLVQELLHKVVETAAADLVQSGNIVRLDGSGEIKNAISGADSPVLLIRAYAIDIRPRGNSTGSEVDRTYRISIGAGFKADSTINAVEWKLTCALVQLVKACLDLRWEGKAFVYDVQLNTAFIDRAASAEELPFTQDLWVSGWPIKVRMKFATSALETEAQLCHTAADLLA